MFRRNNIWSHLAARVISQNVKAQLIVVVDDVFGGSCVKKSPFAFMCVHILGKKITPKKKRTRKMTFLYAFGGGGGGVGGIITVLLSRTAK